MKFTPSGTFFVPDRCTLIRGDTGGEGNLHWEKQPLLQRFHAEPMYPYQPPCLPIHVPKSSSLCTDVLNELLHIYRCLSANDQHSIFFYESSVPVS